MEMKQEIREINERLTRIEYELQERNHQTVRRGSFIVDFGVAFVVVFAVILVGAGVFSIFF
ncbi:hypothetical protein [Paenibacillus sp. 1P07SE]|uniref:hypothetical protein n=1 Tax=Paenibacillus sp. 1P07SE TaxID=3132209 RepID=UPI0039A707F9